MSQQEMSMKPQGSVQGSAAPPGYGQLQYGGQQPPAQGMPANYGQQQHLPPGYEQGPPQYGAAPPPPGGQSHGSFAPSVPPPGNMPAGKPPGPMMAPYAPGQVHAFRFLVASCSTSCSGNMHLCYICQTWQCAALKMYCHGRTQVAHTLILNEYLKRLVGDIQRRG